MRYRCLGSLSNGEFIVQSADFYHDGKESGASDRQFIELLTEDNPTQRSKEYETLADAIAAHKRDFSQ